MVATLVDGDIDSISIVNTAVGLDIYRQDKFYISRFELFLNNAGDQWGNTWFSGDPVVLEIDTVQVFLGKVDNVKTKSVPWFVDKQVLVVSGRGYGVNLADLYMTKQYPTATVAKGDDIIDDALDVAQAGLGAPEKITYTSPGTAAELPVTFRRAFLLDKFREIANRLGYNGYVADTKALAFFAEGSVASGITLKSVADATDNNILLIEEGEQIGVDIKNYVELYAGKLRDHYSDENAADLVPGAGCTIANEYAYKLPTNASSLKLTRGAGGRYVMYWDFPLYNYTTLNLSRTCEGYFFAYHDMPVGATLNIRPRLIDIHGSEIEWIEQYKAAAQEEQGPTEGRLPFYWNKIAFPLGTENPVSSVATKSKKWHWEVGPLDIDFAGAYTSCDIDDDDGTGKATLTADGGTPYSNVVAGDRVNLHNCEDAANNGDYFVYSATDTVITLTDVLAALNNDDTAISIYVDFNWEQVEMFVVDCGTPVAGATPSVYIDYLSIPTVEVISIAESAASSVLYGKKMMHEAHLEASSQIELDEICDDILLKRKFPLETIEAWAIGQTGNRYAVKTVEVNAPPYGIAAATVYRILKIHHQVRQGGVGQWDTENFVTRYTLVADQYLGSDQEVDPERLLGDVDPVVKALEVIRGTITRWYASTIPDVVQTYARVPGDSELAGYVIYDLFANRPAVGTENGEMFYATDTGQWFYWNATTPAWVEATRAEAKIRLAQIIEKLHNSLGGTTSGQHHDKSHKGRHPTIGGADALDTQSTGSHTHSLAAEDTDSAEGLSDAFYASKTGVMECGSVAGRIITGAGPYWVAGASGGATTTQLPISSSKNFTEGPGSGEYVLIGYDEMTHARMSHTHPLLGVSASDGSHDHNVTTSPSADLLNDDENPMMVCLEDQLLEDGRRRIVVIFPEFSKRIDTVYAIGKTEDMIIKDLKGLWHGMWEHRKKIEALPPPKDGPFKDRKVRWNRDAEKLYMDAQLADSGESEREAKESGDAMEALFG